MARAVVAITLALVASPVFAQSDDWQYRGRGRDRGVHLRILKDYRLPAGSTAQEPIVVLGGSADVEGHARSDVVVIGGTLRVGPAGRVDGDAVAMGGRARIEPGARIAGDLEEVSIVGPDLDLVRLQMAEGWWAVAALGATLVRLTLVLAVALLLTAVTPGWVETIADRVSPGTSVLVGVTGQVLFVPSVVAIAVSLVVSIVGIPLLAGLPLLLGAAATAWAAGFAAVAVRLGRRLRGRAALPSRAVDLLTGFTVIAAVTLVAHSIALGPEWMRPAALAAGTLGLLIEYVAWTIGLGAAMASILGSRSVRPPGVPMHSPEPSPTS